MSINSKMTAIADEIRELSGTTGAIGLDDMATHIGEANDEVDSQVELLAQAVAALEGKASGGSDGDSNVSEWICVGTLPTTYWIASADFYYEVPSNCRAILVKYLMQGEEEGAFYGVTYKNPSDGCFTECNIEDQVVVVSDADGTGTIIKITSTLFNFVYILPIF